MAVTAAQTKVTKVTIDLDLEGAEQLRDTLGPIPHVGEHVYNLYSDLVDVIGYGEFRSPTFEDEPHGFTLKVSVHDTWKIGDASSDINVWQVRNHLRKYLAENFSYHAQVEDIRIEFHA